MSREEFRTTKVVSAETGVDGQNPKLVGGRSKRPKTGF